jgi:hypothetical protein
MIFYLSLRVQREFYYSRYVLYTDSSWWKIYEMDIKNKNIDINFSVHDLFLE